MYSIALVAISAAAAMKGDLREGLVWMTQPGTFDEYTAGATERTWSVAGKVTVLALFSSMGFFGSSCSAAITKNFGALTMSITSTARKATTLFLSFFLFRNVCTVEHVAGIVLFIAALTTKSLRRGRKSSQKSKKKDDDLQQQSRKKKMKKKTSLDAMEAGQRRGGGSGGNVLRSRSGDSSVASMRSRPTGSVVHVV